MPTAAVRLGLPATQALPPMVDWLERLSTALGGHVYLCRGGNEFDGRPISELDPGEQVADTGRLALVGPRYFGYDIDYVPVEQRFGIAKQ